MQLVDIMLLNDSEARELVQEPNLILAARKDPRTRPHAGDHQEGEHGVLMLSEDSLFALTAYPLEFVYDPTGAGDTFGGGFLGSLSRFENFDEKDLRRSIVYGSVMASYNVEAFSCDRLRNLTFEDIDKRYYEFLKITRFE